MTDIGSLLGQAASLMITGMGVVFVFLTILVYLVRLMSRIVPQEVPQPIAPIQNQNTQSTSSTVSPQVVAAISAAVHKYRNSETKK
ncbi:oxaloacetate decarboxylase subunit gamma [Vibrio sp. JC009]|uniref:oxaloacetate decarboxylase subunit gamma n=1 Tax=Vibrio sp. JC009 TaxID=2912314 RepID=UPI0023B1A00E|nr:oxaloacetate decarboxylase subunit gamma [Vibrio sp. JC009]WED21406.1 oxaloacetate decarboxylase subunit gamma [Vibrio sp. JC009]